MQHKKILVWFRNDLRFHDNETLHAAIRNSDEIVPVFVIDERLIASKQFSSKRIGDRRLNFLLQALQDLRTHFHQLGADLLVIKGNPAVEIPRLALEHGINAVYYNQEVGHYERSDEALVQANLNKHKIEWESFWTSTLIPKDDLPFSVHQLPSVFTSFRQKIEKECSFGKIMEQPDQIRTPIFNEIIPDITSFGFELPSIHRASAFPFLGGETKALEHLHNYLWSSQHVATYKETRNEMVGTAYSTKFSPWLAWGCLSPRMIMNELYKFESQIVKNESTYWVLFELLWRDFFKFSAYINGNKLFRVHGIKGITDKQWKKNTALFEAWKNGETGNAFIDANMKELNATGWMSNRGRQNVASFLVHDLELDWRWGAAYFEEKLLDYDVSSNWGNWAYIAGVGHDPRPFRKFNIEKQAHDYDKNKAFRNLWLNN